MSEQEQIETVLATVERPTFVTEIRHALDDDWSGDPAVWIWVILRDDTAEDVETDLRSKIVEAVQESGVNRWPYVRFRTQSEQAELDRAEAA